MNNFSRHLNSLRWLHRSYSTAVPVPNSPAAVIVEALTKKVGDGIFTPPKLTLKQKFRLFWKNLYVDYKEVAVDTLKEAQAKPVKASFYLSIAGGVLYMHFTNPKEYQYISELTKYDTEVSILSPDIRNPFAEKYCHNLLKLKMKRELRYQSFELFSIVWKHDVDKTNGLFEAKCKYLKPLWSEVQDRFVDIGLFGRFWMLERNMLDYDVNPYEWEVEAKQIIEEEKEIVSKNS
ncbi:hypothetical protein Ocin01_01005 [Orchesella cincta]|uniref:Uncharacterized protein n=1 Tax=Orchesella cincta TaxID=48709 RepID=A0A1D2NK89_ORCCI|nr:hypothetical protein Ocin01_01005 [Orchesella cincta]